MTNKLDRAPDQYLNRRGSIAKSPIFFQRIDAASLNDNTLVNG